VVVGSVRSCYTLPLGQESALTHRLKSPVPETEKGNHEQSGNERKRDVHLGIDLDRFLIERHGLVAPLLHRNRNARRRSRFLGAHP
jgi:hypothetical protein